VSRTWRKRRRYLEHWAPIRIDNHISPWRYCSNILKSTPSFSNPVNGLGNQLLPDFEHFSFLLSAPGTSEYATIKSRFVGVDLPQHHRRRALRTSESPEKARESPEKARTLGYRLCWHVPPSCLQAGVLQNSQPPTPDQRSLSVMNLPWALIGHIARRLSTVGACVRPTISLCSRMVG
jgi:hypothetical protein